MIKGKVKYNGNYFRSGDWVEGGEEIFDKGRHFIKVTEEDDFGNVLREIIVEVDNETITPIDGE